MRILVCQCGCKESFETNKKGLPPAYQSGHPIIYCACGCGELVRQKRNKPSRITRYIRGHHLIGKPNIYSAKPNSKNHRTAREQSRKKLDLSICQMAHIGGCKGRIECHHIDKNPLNRDMTNLLSVCKSHHCLLDLERITIDSIEMPEYRTGSDGKRRYKWPR